jgi:hypothetical protein
VRARLRVRVRVRVRMRVRVRLRVRVSVRVIIGGTHDCNRRLQSPARRSRLQITL